MSVVSSISAASVGEVFGVDRHANPLSYVERKIDEDFKNALQGGRYSAIVIYGTSKQGKSSLRRHVLPEPFCVFVAATSGMTQERLYRNILNQARAVGPLKVQQSGKLIVGGQIETKVPQWLLPLAAKLSVSGEAQVQANYEEVGIDLSDADGVARRYLAAVGPRPIVIDNFHYFTPEMQRNIAIDIRAFEERGIKIVVMGTWKAQNYLEMQNGDLAGTVCPLSIEPWSEADFNRVIDAGEARLKVKFEAGVREELVRKAAGNIGLIQNALRDLVSSPEFADPSNPSRFSDVTGVREIYRRISNGLLEAMIDKLKRVANIGEPWLNGRTRTYYILRAFIEDPESSRVEGVPLPRLSERLNKMIERLDPGRMMNEQAFGLLVKRDLLAGQQARIETPVIAYDSEGVGAGRLMALDSWLLVTIRIHRHEILARF